MKYAILAAGLGARLQEEGVTTPKPLIPIGGTPLIDRLIHTFIAHGAEEIAVVINAATPQLYHHLTHAAWHCPLHVTVADTPTSLHSLYALLPRLAGGKVCITTVDTLFRPEEFTHLIDHFERDTQQDAIVAVTTYTDDDTPLYVEVDRDTLQVTAFLDHRPPTAHPYVSGGIYCLTPTALAHLTTAVAQGVGRLRNFQRYLLQQGAAIEAHPFRKMIDLDHASLIPIAEQWLNTPYSDENSRD